MWEYGVYINAHDKWTMEINNLSHIIIIMTGHKWENVLGSK